MMDGTYKKEKKGIYQYIKDVPSWYSAVKWLFPITVGVMAALLIAGMTTGLMAVPAFLSGLGALPVLYANLSAFGSFSLLAISTMTVAMFTGGAAALLTRVGLFPMVETRARENYKAVEVYLTETEGFRATITKDLNLALAEISQRCDELTKENEVLKVQQGSSSVLFSNEAMQVDRQEMPSTNASNDALVDSSPVSSKSKRKHKHKHKH